MMKVFLVEDSEVVRQRLTGSLREIGSVDVVGEAHSERDAIEGIRAAQPDAAIVDLQLKKGNGMNVLTAVRSQNASILLIVLTNFAYPQYRSKCMASGADFFFDKSSEFVKVAELLQERACAQQAPSHPQGRPQ